MVEYDIGIIIAENGFMVMSKGRKVGIFNDMASLLLWLANNVPHYGEKKQITIGFQVKKDA